MRIQSGGKWDGTNYTAPVGDEFYQPYDTSTDVGMLKSAAFLSPLSIDSVAPVPWMRLQPYYPAADVAVWARLPELWARGVLGRDAARNGWTVAERVKFAEEMASGAADVTTPAEFIEVIEQARSRIRLTI